MTVRWTSQAAADLQQICDAIRNDNPEAALALARGIYDRIEALKSHPYRGRIGRVDGTRELVLAPFPTLLSTKAVIVLRILHGARRWP